MDGGRSQHLYLLTNFTGEMELQKAGSACGKLKYDFNYDLPWSYKKDKTRGGREYYYKPGGGASWNPPE